MAHSTIRSLGVLLVANITTNPDASDHVGNGIGSVVNSEIGGDVL